MAKSITVGVSGLAQADLRASLLKLQSAAVDVCLVSGGLAIHGSASALVKTGSTAYLNVNGTLVKLAAADLPALVGTVTNAKFNVFVFTVNSAGTVAVAMGTEAATIGAVVFPTIPADSAVLGFIIVNPTGTGNFVGGTTALDDATVVPNVVYVNTPFPFNPNALSL